MSKTKTQNIKASFWRRFLSMIIDFIIFFGFLLITSILVIDKKIANFHKNYFYYIWIVLIIIYILLIWIIIPIISKGQTIGMLITKLKIIPSLDKYKLNNVILQRQILFAWLWIIVLCLFIIFVSPETFIEASKLNKQTINQLTITQRGFISIPLTLSAVTAFMDSFLIITTAKNSRISWNDSFSNSFVVYKNKFETIIEDDDWQNNNIKPKKRILPKINFIN
ncbi:RDD family protein [Mycoplasma zalophi]|uniref:RDD family protein n=1 Tax=Mycoplasma zalophi TaxID=191287 RepID=UPI0021C75632|nr:RDD family protein [Mycoplasma zalophi]MCU4116998.1 RDD family protein [Mycoplasma zalophi]